MYKETEVDIVFIGKIDKHLNVYSYLQEEKTCWCQNFKIFLVMYVHILVV